jgi:hypothetical protein
MSDVGVALQDKIRALGEGGWNALDDLGLALASPEIKARAEEDKARRDAAKRRFRADLLEVFSSAAGMRVLEGLVDATLNRPPVNLGSTGLTSDQVGVMMSFRQGQDSVIHSILKDLEKEGFNAKGDAA